MLKMALQKCLLKSLSVALLATPLAALADPVYSMSFAPAGFEASYFAAALNNAGQVIGTADNAAAIWSGSTLTSLRPVLGDSGGHAINDRGDVAGYIRARGENFAFSYVSGTLHEFHSTLPAWTASSSVTGINVHGQVAGTAYPRAGESWRGFVNLCCTSEIIGTFNDWGGSDASAINDLGQLVGTASLLSKERPVEFHAFRYENGSLIDLGALEGERQSQASDINNAGQAVGWSSSKAANMAQRPVLFQDGGVFDLGTLGGNGQANAINGAGVIVGESGVLTSQRTHAFLYEGGRMLDLNTLLAVPANGWELVSAWDVNDSGQILARACQNLNCTYVRLDPVSAVPEPDSGALLLAGLALAGVRHRRRREGGDRAGFRRDPA
jgi:probable HAF family extracellular repeat protein